jgi:hypothetical protein
MTALQNTPSDVVRYLLVQLDVATLPTDGDDWPAYEGQEPDSPDDCITVYTTTGVDDGRSMIDGELWQHYGVQVRVRSSTSVAGWQKANAIRDAMAKEVQREIVAVPLEPGGTATTDYRVAAISKIGQTIPLGKEPHSNRFLFTVNVKVPIQGEST